MKKITLLASLALAFVSLTANATDKFFYKIATDKDPGWTIQDAANFEGTPGKEYYQAYNKKNGGRRLNFAFPESTWEKIDLDKLPNKTYKWSMDLNMTTMDARSDLELTVLPVGTSLTDSRNSTHNKHWNNANEGEDFFFRFRVVTKPEAANGDFTIQINETPASATDWTASTNPDSLCVLSSNVKYTFAVEVNTETNVATYTILNGETVVKTGTHEYVCDDRIGVQTLSMNGQSVHQLSNMGLSYFVDGVIAENPSVDLFWVEGTERDYFAQFKEGEVLHWIQLGDAQSYSGETYENGKEYTVEYSAAKESRGFEDDPDAEGGQKIITCMNSGTLVVWTTREEDETNKSDEIAVNVACEVVNLPAPEAKITNVSEGYGKEYTLSVDNSDVILKPTITIVYELTENGKVTKGEVLSGEKVSFTGAGTLKIQSADLTNKTEHYGRSEFVIVENNTEYAKAATRKYDVTFDEAKTLGLTEDDRAVDLKNGAAQSHWERIYSEEARGYKADGTNEAYVDGTDYEWVKKGFGVIAASEFATATWKVYRAGEDNYQTVFDPLVPAAGTAASWTIFPLEGIVYDATDVANLDVNVNEKYVSDDTTKPNFFVVHTRGGYDRPDKGDCNVTTVKKVGEAYSLYRYDTAICDVTVYTYKGFVEGSGATSVAAPKAVVEDANAPIFTIGGVKVTTTVPGKIYIQNGKKFLAK